MFLKGKTENIKNVKRKFSSFFKSLVIELDKDLYGPDNNLVEVRIYKSKSKKITQFNFLSLQWHRTPQTAETDGFQVKRAGDQNVKCKILMLLDYQVIDHHLFF